MQNYFKITTEKGITISKGNTIQDLRNVLKQSNVDANVKGYIKDYKYEEIKDGEVIETEIVNRK